MGLGTREATFFFLVSLALTPVYSSRALHAQQSLKVYIYDFPDTLSEERILSYFGNRSDCDIIVRSLIERVNSDKFLGIVRALIMSGVEVVPEGQCLPCLTYRYRWEEIVMMFASPLIEVFRGGRLTAITLGISGLGGKDHEILDQALLVDAEHVTVFTPSNVYDVEVSSEEDVTMDVVELPLVGQVDLSSTSLPAVTVLVSLADGFNPCSLWVLLLLLGIVVYSGPRRKVVLVGLTFLAVAATVYGLFMIGLFSVFTYVGYLTWIRAVVAITALAFALVNIKEYFWYKKGISLTIPDRYKPRIFKSIREIMSPEKSVWAILGGTATMALGVTLFELPCTIGFPLIWTKIMAEHNPGLMTFVSLFLLYLIVYLLDEIAVFTSIVLTLKATRLEEKHGRMLKLVGGMIMLALSLAMIVKPDLMGSVEGLILVLGISAVLALLAMFVHRKVLPKFGVGIGTEEMKRGLK